MKKQYSTIQNNTEQKLPKYSKKLRYIGQKFENITFP